MKIEIKGTAIYCQYASIQRMQEEEEDFWGIYYDYFYIESGIQVLADGEDITKKKGKYVMVPDLIKNQIVCDDQPFPVEFRIVHDVEYYGWVELDVEDFDPKKLQLRKNTYEFEMIPYSIDGYTILYDGKEIQLNTEYMDDYCDRWGYGEDNSFTIE